MFAISLEERLDRLAAYPLPTNSPGAFSITPAFKNARMSPEHGLVIHAPRDATHQQVVVDPVEKLFQIDVHGEPIAFGEVRLGLGHCWVGTSPRARGRNCEERMTRPNVPGELRGPPAG